jgi:phosphoglycerate dehydrogenase-like enzyme
LIANATRIAVLSRSFSRHPVLRAELSELHPNVTFNDTGRTLAGAELVSFLTGHEAAIVALEQIDESVFAKLPGLRVISKYGVGLDNVDLQAASRHGIKVGWTGGVNRRSVAELTIAFMVVGLRGVMTANSEIRAGTWRQQIGRQLSDVTVGLMGCGHVGQEVVQLLSTWGTRILAYDVRSFPEFYAKYGVKPVDFETLLTSSDVISLHVPLTKATRTVIGAEQLAKMKRGSILVNAARGGLVDENALTAALRNGPVAAACFDVFGIEPPDSPELMTLPNFLATPHIGGSAEEAILAMGRAAISGISTATDPLTHIPPWAG